MDDVLISPVKSSQEPTLPPVGLLFLNPFEARRAAAMARDHKMAELRLFNSQLFSSGAAASAFFVAGPAVGAPMAVMCLEKLIACGAEAIIVMGWCGALQASLSVGNLILPTWAQSDEGTSPHYPISHRATTDDRLRQQLAPFVQNHFHAPIIGPMWTTDAPYRETCNLIKKYQKEGLLAADMEFSALNTVATFRGIKLAAVMLVSDLLYGQGWQPGFHTKSFKLCSRKLVELLFDFCQKDIR